jgi:hypothetical protein
MALQKDHRLAETYHENLYIKFVHLILREKSAQAVNVRGVMHAFSSKDAADSGSQPVCYFDVEFDYDLASTLNLWEQAYAAAKSKDFMEGAADV